MRRSIFPAIEEPVLRARMKLVIWTSLGIAFMLFSLLAYWIVTGSLEEVESIYSGVIFSLILVGIAVLARSGHITLAGWGLTVLIALVVISTVMDYGIATAGPAGFFIPILLAAMALGVWSGMGVALVGCVMVWGVAIAASQGQLQPQIPFDESDISFTAPAFTILYLLLGFMVGSWSHSLTQAFKNLPKP